uniref:Uncharacterized protein n=1 Tax=Myotis myotis TaxID=51298 RepID=A0A7J7UPN3_MYOMY|nr:hypothetical protein mMyoMyo1_008555 [Myotis myotis]
MPSPGGAASSQDRVPLGQGRRAGSAGKGTPGRERGGMEVGMWVGLARRPAREGRRVNPTSLRWTPTSRKKTPPPAGRGKGPPPPGAQSDAPQSDGGAAGAEGKGAFPEEPPPTRRTRGARPRPPASLAPPPWSPLGFLPVAPEFKG